MNWLKSSARTGYPPTSGRRSPYRYDFQPEQPRKSGLGSVRLYPNYNTLQLSSLGQACPDQLAATENHQTSNFYLVCPVIGGIRSPSFKP